jgi:hypothetical protein
MAVFRILPEPRKSDPKAQISREHRAHATGTTQLRSHDGQVKQSEQEVLHAETA